MAEPKRLIVTGASGLIGGAVARHFGARGWQVLALARNIPDTLGPGITHVPYALDRALSVEALAGAQALVHCAYARGDFALNLAAAETLLGACQAVGVRQKVFLSSLSAKEGARSAYGRQKLAIERRFSEEGGTVVRAGLVIGDGGLFAAMGAHLRAGRPVPLIDGGRQPVQVVALDDLVHAIQLVIDRELRGSFVVAHTESVPFREFYRILGARLGVCPRFLPLPYHLVNAALWLGKALGLRLPVDRDSLHGLRAMSYVDPRADLERLGIGAKSFAQALDELP